MKTTCALTKKALKWIDESPYTLIIDPTQDEKGRFYFDERTIALKEESNRVLWHELTHVAQNCMGYGMETVPLGINTSKLDLATKKAIQDYYPKCSWDIEYEAFLVMDDLKLRIQLLKYLEDFAEKMKQKR